ncbi:hypothetical protein RRG08_015335 [Elysia crispata]|uniref:Secreted protein n=1 Tax=Elysia crispata TaxID=231223 RepID=A0AAE1A8J9_9GAST|nr:hypothetical protein RRG08_057668 [Elysia crispata]KAK3782995.1 hypothetical protein RRG08_015335 [Elysia crispata]
MRSWRFSCSTVCWFFTGMRSRLCYCSTAPCAGFYDTKLLSTADEGDDVESSGTEGIKPRALFDWANDGDDADLELFCFLGQKMMSESCFLMTLPFNPWVLFSDEIRLRLDVRSDRNLARSV